MKKILIGIVILVIGIGVGATLFTGTSTTEETYYSPENEIIVAYGGTVWENTVLNQKVIYTGNIDNSMIFTIHDEITYQVCVPYPRKDKGFDACGMHFWVARYDNVERRIAVRWEAL